MLLPKTYRIHCQLFDEYIQFSTIILVTSSFISTEINEGVNINKWMKVHIFCFVFRAPNCKKSCANKYIPSAFEDIIKKVFYFLLKMNVSIILEYTPLTFDFF